MSLWVVLLERLEPIRPDLRKRFWPENPTSHVDFSIAFIALAARLAKADGQVSRSEVAASSGGTILTWFAQPGFRRKCAGLQMTECETSIRPMRRC